MDVTPLIKKDTQIIQSYHNSNFRVSGHVYNNPIIVTPEKTIDWNVRSEAKEVQVSSFKPLFLSDIDVILLGTGKLAIFMPPLLRSHLKEKGLILEVMDTGAACRTYNVLMAEGRRVAAALFPYI